MRLAKSKVQACQTLPDFAVSSSEYAVRPSSEPYRERRLTPRKRTVGSVYVFWSRRSPERCQVLNLSTAGALIDPRQLRIPKGRLIELAFVHHVGAVIKLYRRSAVVIRRSPDGLGLMFVRRPANLR